MLRLYQEIIDRQCYSNLNDRHRVTLGPILLRFDGLTQEAELTTIVPNEAESPEIEPFWADLVDKRVWSRPKEDRSESGI